MTNPRRNSPYTARDDEKLITELLDPEIADNPLKFVMFAFPWGKANTPLHAFSRPRTWQCEEFERMADHIKNNKALWKKREELRIKLQGKVTAMELDKALVPLNPILYQSAIASGRGPGKSAFVSMVDIWMMSTRLGSTCINTANTEAQLKSRTWAELGKWHTLSINSHWFEKTALSLRPEPWFEEALKKQLKIDTGYYYAQAQLWSEEKPDAFAGAHNHHGILLAFDEASGIPEPIWTVSEGFFTEPILDRYWFVFSNPRRNTGPFFEAFNKHRDHWYRRHIDSRKVEGTDKTRLDAIVKKFGEDSDEARVEVKGEFPRQGDDQFISRDIIEESVTRELVKDEYAPLIMGVDIARFGNDKSVIRFRQGRDARSIAPIKISKKDNMEVANECAHWIQTLNPDAVCIDAGNGTGVIDRLRELGFKVHEVWFGSKAEDEEWANKRTEMWARMRDWIKGACIDGDEDLIDDLAGPRYRFMAGSDKMMLESKEEMKRRGIASPDNGDALACTFAVKVASRDLNAARRKFSGRNRIVDGVDYKIFS